MPQAPGACAFTTRAPGWRGGIWFQGRNYKDATIGAPDGLRPLRQLCLYDKDMAFRKIN
jgi:hypothetical protein